MSKYSKTQQAESLASLRELLAPGDTIYYHVNHVSRSGMFRRIAFQIVKDGRILDITWNMARVLGQPCNDDGLGVGGCGMDMGFSCIYDLARTLYPEGFNCAGKHRCRANDHTNGQRSYAKRIKHRDGGYAFNYSATR